MAAGFSRCHSLPLCTRAHKRSRGVPRGESARVRTGGQGPARVSGRKSSGPHPLSLFIRPRTGRTAYAGTPRENAATGGWTLMPHLWGRDRDGGDTGVPDGRPPSKEGPRVRIVPLASKYDGGAMPTVLVERVQDGAGAGGSAVRAVSTRGDHREAPVCARTFRATPHDPTCLRSHRGAARSAAAPAARERPGRSLGSGPARTHGSTGP